MWDAIAAFSSFHDPIAYESPDPSSVAVLNAGPGAVIARAWPNVESYNSMPPVTFELRPGGQAIVRGSLVRLHVAAGEYAAVGWRLVGFAR